MCSSLYTCAADIVSDTDSFGNTGSNTGSLCQCVWDIRRLLLTVLLIVYEVRFDVTDNISNRVQGPKGPQFL